MMKIEGTIINASFPRSGHRFLRNILVGYFDDAIVAYEPYADRIIGRADAATAINYVKTHDFGLLGVKELIDRFPLDRRYLVQLRHPLESIVSYYEFALRRGHLANDDVDAWNAFLHEKLEYWEKFVGLWGSLSGVDCCQVTYESLVRDTVATLTRVIQFLTNGQGVDMERLHRAVNQTGFYQYVEEQRMANPVKAKRKVRSLRDFAYFNEDVFGTLERRFIDRLADLNISPLLQGPQER